MWGKGGSAFSETTISKEEARTEEDTGDGRFSEQQPARESALCRAMQCIMVKQRRTPGAVARFEK